MYIRCLNRKIFLLISFQALLFRRGSERYLPTGCLTTLTTTLKKHSGIILRWFLSWIDYVCTSHLNEISLTTILLASLNYNETTLGEFNEVKFSAYRTSMKLRVLQKKLCCKKLFTRSSKTSSLISCCKTEIDSLQLIWLPQKK